MAQVSVSSNSYRFLNTIYYIMCISGCVWQVFNVSSNFFKYDVIRDINIKPVKGYELQALDLYVCFFNSQILNHSKMNENSNRCSLDIFNCSIYDRFEITVDAESIFRTSDNLQTMIVDWRYCFRSSDQILKFADPIDGYNVTHISFLKSQSRRSVDPSVFLMTS